MKFGEALEASKQGQRGNGRGMYLELQHPDAHSKIGRPYIYISDVQVASQTDMLAEDWEVVS